MKDSGWAFDRRKYSGSGVETRGAWSFSEARKRLGVRGASVSPGGRFCFGHDEHWVLA